MKLYNRLLKDYGKNNAFQLKDIQYSDMSKAAVKNALKRLVAKGLVEKYLRGVYYIPSQSIFGKKTLDSEAFIRNNYLYKGDEVIGVYKGYKLLNELGLTTQVPALIEIMSNNAPAEITEEHFGPSKVALSRPPVKITKDNAPLVKVMALLEEAQFKDAPEENRLQAIRTLIKKPYSRQAVSDMVTHYPLKTSKALISTGAIYEIAQ